MISLNGVRYSGEHGERIESVEDSKGFPVQHGDYVFVDGNRYAVEGFRLTMQDRFVLFSEAAWCVFTAPADRVTLARITTVAELKAEVDVTGSNFFNRKAMKAFGDTMSSYDVVGPRVVERASGGEVIAYELFRRKPAGSGLRSSAYFDARTFERVYVKDCAGETPGTFPRLLR